MKKVNFRWLLVFTASLLLVVLACSVSFNNGEEEPSAEKTLRAIYMQDTVEALAAEAEQAVPAAGGETAVEASAALEGRIAGVRCQEPRATFVRRSEALLQPELDRRDPC